MRLNNVFYYNDRLHIIVVFHRQYDAVQKQTAVTAYYESMLLLLFAEM